MKNLIFFFALIFGGAVVGQTQQNSQEFLYSSGETPNFLKDYESRYFIPEKEPWIKWLKRDKQLFYLDIIYSSNMIVYGD